MADELILGFALASGEFKSELRMPLPRGKKDIDRAVEPYQVGCMLGHALKSKGCVE